MVPAKSSGDTADKKRATTAKKDPPPEHKCPKCDLLCKDVPHLKNHVVTHFKDIFYSILPNIKPYQCPECSKILRDIIGLTRHYAFAHQKLYELTDLTSATLEALGVVHRGPRSAIPKTQRRRPKNKQTQSATGEEIGRASCRERV